MANLPEESVWHDGIYQIETTDPVVGGTPNRATKAGLSNVPLKELAERTRYLLELIEGLPPEMTARELLAKLIGVDGHNSGLDADKLDGYHATGFLRLDRESSFDHKFHVNGPGSIGLGSNWDGGLFKVGGGWAFDTNEMWNKYSSTIGTLSGNLNLVPFGGLFCKSNLVWHAGNDGAGSGLDADMLDGKQAADFYGPSDLGTKKQIARPTIRLTNGGTKNVSPGETINLGQSQVCTGINVNASREVLSIRYAELQILGVDGTWSKAV